MTNETMGDTSVAPENTRPMTFGEKAVGLSFNPGGMESVNEVKKLFADIIDIVNPAEPQSETTYMKNTLKGMATRACIMAQMAVVKFITWKD